MLTYINIILIKSGFSDGMDGTTLWDNDQSWAVFKMSVLHIYLLT